MRDASEQENVPSVPRFPTTASGLFARMGGALSTHRDKLSPLWRPLQSSVGVTSDASRVVCRGLVFQQESDRVKGPAFADNKDVIGLIEFLYEFDSALGIQNAQFGSGVCRLPPDT